MGWTGRRPSKKRDAAARRELAKMDTEAGRVRAPLVAGDHVYFRAWGAERVGKVIAPVSRGQVLLQWVTGDLTKREKWVTVGLIFRKLLPHESTVAGPSRGAPFYCLDADHRHPAQHLRDDCVRAEGERTR